MHSADATSHIMLLLLKYSASIIAAAYGVYATVTDFKEEKNGKKILSRKGRWGIALLLFSTLINLSSDGYKDIQDRKAAAVEEDRRLKAVEDQRQISNALAQQGSALKQNLAGVQTLGKDLNETSKRLQRGIVGQLTKVDSFSTTVAFYKNRMDWHEVTNAESEDQLLNMFWCIQPMRTGYVDIPIAPGLALYFQIERGSSGRCSVTKKVIWSGREIQMPESFDMGRFKDAVNFSITVDRPSFDKLNPLPFLPEAITFAPQSDLAMRFVPPTDHLTDQSYSELANQLEQSLPSEIHLHLLPNMRYSEYATTWAFGSRQILIAKDLGLVVVRYRQRKTTENLLGLP